MSRCQRVSVPPCQLSMILSKNVVISGGRSSIMPLSLKRSYNLMRWYCSSHVMGTLFISTRSSKGVQCHRVRVRIPCPNQHFVSSCRQRRGLTILRCHCPNLHAPVLRHICPTLGAVLYHLEIR